MKTDFASWVIIWVNLAYRGPTLYFACLCQHFRLSHIFSHVAPLHLQWTKGLSLSPSRFLASQPQGTRSSLHPPFLASFFCKIAHCFAFRPPLFYSCAWLIVWGRRTGWGWGTMHHQFRPIDPHAPSLCPSQLVLQENRKTAWGSGLAVALTHTHRQLLGSLQIYIQRTWRVCGCSVGDFCFIELLRETQQLASTSASTSAQFNIRQSIAPKKQYVGDRWWFVLNRVVAFGVTVHPSRVYFLIKMKKSLFAPIKMVMNCDLLSLSLLLQTD